MQNWLQFFPSTLSFGELYSCNFSSKNERKKKKKKKKNLRIQGLSLIMTHQIYFKNIACMPQKASIILGFFISLPITTIISKFSYDKSTVLN